MSVNIKTTLQSAANKLEIAEEVATRFADYLIEEGYEMSKPVKPENKPDQKEIEKVEESLARQGNNVTEGTSELRVQPENEKAKEA